MKTISRMKLPRKDPPTCPRHAATQMQQTSKCWRCGFHDCSTTRPLRPGDLEFWPLLRSHEETLARVEADVEKLERVADEHRTALASMRADLTLAEVEVEAIGGAK